MATVLTQFLDRCIWTPASGGTGSFVLSAAVTGFQTMAAAGAVNGVVYGYAAQSSDLSQWEVGYGTWTTGTSTLTRTVTFNSLGTAVAVNFTSPPQVMITAIAETLVGFDAGFSYAGSGALTLALGTITANANALTITGTWNNAAVTFDAPLFMSITNTASAASSAALDIQLGGASKFTLLTNNTSINHLLLTGNGGTGGAAMDIGGATGNTFSFYATGPTGNDIRWALNSQNLFTAFISGGYGWTSTSNASDGAETTFYRDAAGTIGLQRTTNPTTLRVYNTTDTQGGNPTNYERGVFDWTTNANTLTIATQFGGTGSGRNLRLETTGNNSILFFVNSNQQMSITNGTVIFPNSQQVTYGNGSNAPTLIGTNSVPVLQIGNFSGSATAGWMQWAGQTRVTSPVTYTSNVTPSVVTGLSVALAAGRTYSFDVYLSFTDAAAGGIQAQMAATGGLTATAIVYDGWIVDSAANGIKGNATSAALGGVVASSTTTGTAGVVRIKGTITVNVAGTLNVFAAQNTSSGTATTIKQGSYMIVFDMP